MPFPLVMLCSGLSADALCDGDSVAMTVNASTINVDAFVSAAPASGGAFQYWEVLTLPPGYVVACSMSDGTHCPGDPYPYTGATPASYLPFAPASPYQPPFDFSQLDPTQIGYAFSTGFVMIAGAFVFGAPLRALLGLIRGS